MKIIGWNCNGAFRKKSTKILSTNADIIVISECESPEKLKIGNLIPEPKDLKWFGDNANKGIGIFSYSDYGFELLTEYNSKFKYVIPIKVSNEEGCFLLLAIWTKENKYDKNAGYIGQVWFAINYYSNLLFDIPTIIIGDFNSNKIWDKKRPLTNHTQVVNFLKNYEIESLYHMKYGENQGEESLPTFLLQKNLNKPYHIDYCFASKTIFKHDYDLEIEDFENWLELSDHVPIIIDFKWKPKEYEFDSSLKEAITNKISFNYDALSHEIEELKILILEQVNKYEHFDNEKKEALRLKIIENTEDYLKILKLINRIKK